MSMRIATYNVNGINGRLANLLGWLEEASPDIVCLQELKAPDDKFPAAALRAAGYGAVWHGQKSWNGVAILARGASPIDLGQLKVMSAIGTVRHAGPISTPSG
jgi:exodeoxyribonuclease-3